MLLNVRVGLQNQVQTAARAQQIELRHAGEGSGEARRGGGLSAAISGCTSRRSLCAAAACTSLKFTYIYLYHSPLVLSNNVVLLHLSPSYCLLIFSLLSSCACFRVCRCRAPLRAP